MKFRFYCLLHSLTPSGLGFKLAGTLLFLGNTCFPIVLGLSHCLLDPLPAFQLHSLKETAVSGKAPTLQQAATFGTFIFKALLRFEACWEIKLLCHDATTSASSVWFPLALQWVKGGEEEFFFPFQQPCAFIPAAAIPQLVFPSHDSAKALKTANSAWMEKIPKQTIVLILLIKAL